MDHKARTTIISILLAFGLLVPLWMWMRTPSEQVRHRTAVPAATPTRGVASVAVDRSLLQVMELQSRSFSDHYPEAKVALSPEPSGRTMLRLLDREAGAAVVEGGLIREEDSVVASMKRPVKREPIAKTALVVIVNRANPVTALSLGGIRGLFSGKVTDWGQIGGTPGRIVVCVDGSDFRSQAVLSEVLFGKAGRLSATELPDLGQLIARVAEDGQAAAVVTLPEYAAALRSVNGKSIRALPVRRTSTAPAVDATPASVYTGQYPLVSIVYYLYDPFDPTATGFGAWLAKEGQTLFERGDMAPIHQTVRTIILK
jgi:phosphate transport system substrate-binding protein